MYNNLIKLARKLIDLPRSEKKHFTFILRKNKIMSVGWNMSYKTHPLAARYNYKYSAIHSELNAILNFQLPYSTLCKYTILNIRLAKNGTIANSKPCIPCQNLLNDYGLNSVIYSTNEGFDSCIF